MNIIEIVGAILGSSAATGILTALVSRRKYNAEAKQIESSTQVDVAKAAMEYADRIERMFTGRLADLATEINALKVENVALRNKIDQLITENNQLRIEIGKLTHPNDK